MKWTRSVRCCHGHVEVCYGHVMLRVWNRQAAAWTAVNRTAIRSSPARCEVSEECGSSWLDDDETVQAQVRPCTSELIESQAPPTNSLCISGHRAERRRRAVTCRPCLAVAGDVSTRPWPTNSRERAISRSVPGQPSPGLSVCGALAGALDRCADTGARLCCAKRGGFGISAKPWPRNIWRKIRAVVDGSRSSLPLLLPFFPCFSPLPTVFSASCHVRPSLHSLSFPLRHSLSLFRALLHCISLQKWLLRPLPRWPACSRSRCSPRPLWCAPRAASPRRRTTTTASRSSGSRRPTAGPTRPSCGTATAACISASPPACPTTSATACAVRRLAHCPVELR